MFREFHTFPQRNARITVLKHSNKTEGTETQIIAFESTDLSLHRYISRNSYFIRCKNAFLNEHTFMPKTHSFVFISNNRVLFHVTDWYTNTRRLSHCSSTRVLWRLVFDKDHMEWCEEAKEGSLGGRETKCRMRFEKQRVVKTDAYAMKGHYHGSRIQSNMVQFTVVRLTAGEVGDSGDAVK